MNLRVAGLTALPLVAAVFLFALSGESRGDGAAPATAKMCQGCHGKGGVSTRDNVPTIAGISAFVHADYLYAYRDGARICDSPGSKAMCSATGKLTDDQIEELAEYYANMEFAAAAQDFDAEKAAAGESIHTASCAKCHTDGGGNPDDDASILAGQWLPYLQYSMSQFVSAEREQPKAMQRKIEGLSKADVEALAHYYASQQ